MNSLLFTSSLLIFVTSFASHASTASKCKRPVIKKPDKWVPNVNCTSGHTYEETSPERYHCSCRYHCGYICTKIPAKATTTRAPTTPTTLAGKKCEFGSPWIPPNEPTKRCVCKAFNQKPYYSCTTVATTTSAAATTTTAGTTTTGTTTAGTTTTGTTTTTATTTTISTTPSTSTTT